MHLVEVREQGAPGGEEYTTLVPRYLAAFASKIGEQIADSWTSMTHWTLPPPCKTTKPKLDAPYRASGLHSAWEPVH